MVQLTRMIRKSSMQCFLQIIDTYFQLHKLSLLSISLQLNSNYILHRKEAQAGLQRKDTFKKKFPLNGNIP